MFDRKKYKNFALTQLKSRWTPPVLATFISLLILMPNAAVWTIGISNDNPILIPLAIYLIASWIFEMAHAVLFIKMSRSPEPITLNDFLNGIENWKKAIHLGLIREFWIMLWSLLFVIPGIIKRYAYSQAMFIAAEFPNVGAKKAIQISKIITNNHKADLLFLDLSFIGWFILSAITFNIGDLWLTPYIKMTKINAYHDLLQHALDANLIKYEDLSPSN